jgi:hypothetical protein
VHSFFIALKLGLDLSPRKSFAAGFLFGSLALFGLGTQFSARAFFSSLENETEGYGNRRHEGDGGDVGGPDSDGRPERLLCRFKGEHHAGRAQANCQ